MEHRNSDEEIPKITFIYYCCEFNKIEIVLTNVTKST